jgi:hypothetical protein
MQALTFTNNQERELLFDELSDTLRNIAKTRIRNAFTHRYHMNDEQCAQLQRCFDDRYVHQKTNEGVTLLHSSHPVLAALNDWANEHASISAQRATSQGLRVMTIGDSSKTKINKSAHNCLLIDNIREAYRVASTQLHNNSVAKTGLMAKAVDGKTLDCICTVGAQNCTHQADIAFAVNSLYDISLDDIVRIFESHGLQTIIAYCFFPLALFDESLESIDEEIFKLHRSGDKLIFSLNDFSIPYAHDAKRWVALARTTSIRCGDYTIVRENIDNHGPLFVVKLSKVYNHGGQIRMCIPITNYLGESYKVPSIREAAYHRFARRQRTLKHHIVPKHVVDALMSYASRQADEAYKYSELAAVASGLLREIRIGSTVYHRAWKCTTEEFNDVVVSIFIIGASARTNRTKCISAAFRHLSDWQDKEGFGILFGIRNAIYRLAGDLDPTHPEFEKKLAEDNALWRYRILPYEDLIIEEERTSNVTIKFAERNYFDDDESQSVDDEQYSSDESSIESSDDSGTVNDGSSSSSRQSLRDCDDNECAFDVDWETHRAGTNVLKTEIVRSRSVSVVSLIDNGSSEPLKITQTISVENCDKVSFGSFPDEFLLPGGPTLSDLKECPRQRTSSIKSVSTLSTVSGFNIQDVNADPDSRHQIPRNFIAGHCTVNSVWHCLPKHTRPKQRDVLANLRVIALNPTNMIDYTADEVDAFIFKGVYDNNYNGHVFTHLSLMFNCTVYVHVAGVVNTTIIKHASVESKLDCHVYYANHHYTHVPNGGKKDKFPQIVDKVIEMVQNPPKNILDFSAAPGEMAKVLVTDSRLLQSKIVCAHYTPGLKFTHKELVNTRARCIEYKNAESIAKVLKDDKFDFIFYDAAHEYNSEAIFNEYSKILQNLLCDNGVIIIKTFANPHKVWEFGCNFESECIINIKSNENSTERYYAFYGKRIDKNFDSRHFYNKYNQIATEHKLPVNKSKVRNFIAKYFDRICNDKLPNILSSIKNMSANPFTVTAITGYASANKTNYVAEKYPDAVFIAPTKELAIDHGRRGVRSFTPHVALSNILKADVIAIDEFTHFFLEYVSAVHAINPSAKIILMGDVHQTFGIDYDKHGGSLLTNFGIVNNIWDVYVIPQDVTTILNNRYKMNISTHSCINESLIKTDVKITEFIKLGWQIICFNNETCKKLCKQGAKCSTITTFQGSRAHTVVFYIDSASVNSQLNNRVEWIYTALTRHKNTIVVVGAHDYLEKHLMISGTKLCNLQQIRDIYHANEIFVKTLESNRSEEAVTLTQHDEKVADDTITLPIVEHILDNVANFENEASRTAMYIETNTKPAVESGIATIPILAAINHPRTFRGTQIYGTNPLVKHQVSNSVSATVATLLKRYSKKMPKLNERKCIANTNNILSGVCRALYRNDHSMEKFIKEMAVSKIELTRHATEYLFAVQKKMNNSAGYIEQLLKDFSWFDETIDFVNKKQTKYDPEDGWDTKDKVGQGVASMSKRVNFLYGAYARAMLHRVREIARYNNSNVIIATFDSDEKLAEEYTSTRQQCKPGYSWACADVSEWDSMFQRFMTATTSKICEFMGMPPMMIAWFASYRSQWKMTYHSTYGPVRLLGYGKQFSGNPFTICENTICNMGLMNYVFDYVDVQMQLYKGDDSAVLCKSAKISLAGGDLLDITKHKLKNHFGPVGDFAGYVLTDVGMFPDVIRYASKFLNKIYRDEEHFRESVLSAVSCTKTVKSEYELNIGSYAYINMYKNKIINADQVKQLYNFLKSADKISYSTLKEVTKEALVV